MAIELDGHEIEISNPDKILFPDTGFTKGDLIDYYRSVATRMLPHLIGRPLTLERFPNGLGRPGFYQKNASDYFPEWIRRVRVEKADGEVVHVVCDNAATLVYLANQACVAFHVWLSRADQLDRPDRMIFDLDPPGEDWRKARRVALRLKELLDEISLSSFVKTTGSKGYHVVVPLGGGQGFDEVRQTARSIATELERRIPRLVTQEQRKNKRGDRVFLDCLRNAYAQTAVAAYSVRAKPGAPVSTPLEWEELASRPIKPSRYTIRNLHRRLGQKPDPWPTLESVSQRVTGIFKTTKHAKYANGSTDDSCTG